MTQINLETTKMRDSNMELLRITAMLLVLMVHASFLSLGKPTPSDFQIAPIGTFFRFFSQSVSVICVNVFILISGWYGIQMKISRLLAFIFQVYFLNIIVYYTDLIIHGTGGGENSLMSIKDWITLCNKYWFVKAYIILYIFTPAINAFVDKASKKQIEIFLITFFCVQAIIGLGFGTEFAGGNSALSFMGLYTLARYMYLYPIKFTQLNKYAYLAMYLAATMVTTIMAFSQVNKNSDLWRIYTYCSPLVIFASVCILLFFSKISIHSKIINWVAISCFAAYVIHCSPTFFSTYLTTIKEWYDKESTIVFLSYTTLWIAGVFIMSILLDKIRIWVWKLLTSLSNRIHKA